MVLNTNGGAISVSENSLFINCKMSDLKFVFKELCKLVPIETKIKDIKHILSEKISQI